jgi:tripartite-type tricarboxylate transporter receptor subunit TctC
MKKMGIKFFVLGLLFLFSWDTIGMAADFPEKPIRIIIPYSAGPGNDLNARTFQPFFEKYLGQRILIDNIPAGTTKVGTMELIKAKPDGYTLILSSSEAWIGYYYSKTYNFKPWEQMVPIGTLTVSPYALVEVRTESPFKTWGDLVKAAKENPGKLTCGSSGSGGMPELIMNDITEAAGIKTIYVPFAGAAPCGTALYGGHIDFRLCQPSTAAAMLIAGKSRGLAVSTDKRMETLPDVPTFKELGIGGTVYLSCGIWGPPNLPSHIVNTVTKAIEKGTKEREFIKIITQRSQIVLYRSPEELKAHMQNFENEFGPKLAKMYK